MVSNILLLLTMTFPHLQSTHFNLENAALGDTNLILYMNPTR